MMTSQDSSSPHFVLLQHGSHGVVTDFAYLVTQLTTLHGFSYCRGTLVRRWYSPSSAANADRAALKSRHLLFDSMVNHRLASDKGVHACAEKLIEELVPALTEFVAIHGSEGWRVRFSCVGHSFGGILSRYVLMLLKDQHPGLWSQLEFNVYMSVATPHLGATKLNPIFHFGGRLIGKYLSTTYHELLLMGINGGPLANDLISPAAIEALAAFRVRRLYGSLNKDMLVHPTSSMLLIEGVDVAQRHTSAKGQEFVSTHLRPTIYLARGSLDVTDKVPTTEEKIAIALRQAMDFEVAPVVSHSWLPNAHTQLMSTPRLPFQTLMDDVGTDMAAVLSGAAAKTQ
jgi:hypothetical protein